MLKILLTLLLILDLGVFLFLAYGVFMCLKYGDISVVFPGIGIIISLSFFLSVIFIVEAGLVFITWILYRYTYPSSLR